MMARYISGLLLLLTATQLFAQQPTQTVRGTVTDDASNEPLAYVSVSLQNTTFGNVTDSVGNFTINNVPVGRYNILVSRIGYESIVLKEIQVTSAKEVSLNIELKESLQAIGEVVVKPKVNKELPLNSMATAGAVRLDVEEASRYAGGFDDPARLVSAFAGV